MCPLGAYLPASKTASNSSSVICSGLNLRILRLFNKVFIVSFIRKPPVKGACIAACSHGARSIVDDFDSFHKSLEEHEKIVAIVAPSVASNFPHAYLHLNGWLKAQGVEAVFDVSFGAELAARSYADYLHRQKPKMVIAQPCSSIVTFIEIYHPELIPYLMPVDSPMVHTIKMIRQFYPQYHQHKIVMLSPCVSKKREMDAVGMGDYNVVFSSLDAYFKKEHINLREYPAVNYDGPSPERAVLFPTPGGLLRTVKREIQDISRYTRQISGVKRVYRYLLGLPRALSRDRAPLLVDCLSCENGCNAGPGSLNIDLCVDETDYYIEERKEKQCNYYSMLPKQTSNNSDDLYAVIDAYRDEKLYIREYHDLSDNNRLLLPDELEKKAIYKQMYKQSQEDFLNCAACGYGRCEDMALAIYNGLNKTENCHRYRGVRLEIERKLAQEESEKARQLAQEAEKAHQEVLELMAVRQDIEVRKKVEQELREKYEILDSILQNMPIMMVAFNDKGQIAFWNRECEQITGYSSEVMVFNPQAMTYLYPDPAYLKRIMREREEEEHAVRGYETQLTCRDGTRRTILWYDVSREHPIPGWSQWKFGVDLTERKDMEAQLDRLNAVGEMAASIAHEIRNPMTTVRGFLQFLYETHEHEIDREYFPIMIEELDRANEIITEYLSIACNKAIELQKHNLNSIIQALYPIMLADAMLSEKNIDLKLSEIPPILGDHTELRQLIINLVRNGLEAMATKGTVHIRTFAKKDQVILEVEDEGVGISPQHLAQIYNPFFTTKENGTGLGLSVCYSIATRHGAEWSVDSQPGKTIFSIRFPVAEAVATG